MSRRNYLILAHAHRGEARARLAAHLVQQLLQVDGWRLAVSQPGLYVLTRDRHPPVQVIAEGQGVLVGDLFDANGAPCTPPALTGASPAAFRRWASHILKTRWGRFVALLRAENGGAGAALRDPSGALAGVWFSAYGVTVLGADPPDAVLRLIAADLSIAWPRVAQHLCDPSLISASSPLGGVQTIAPGALHLLREGGRPLQLWRPSSFAGTSRADFEAAGSGLRATIDGVVQAFAQERSVLAEVSGGLDSALVAASLSKAHADVRAWIHFACEGPAADEHAYAAAIAEQLGLELTVLQKVGLPGVVASMLQLQHGPEVSLNGFDAEYEDHILGLARETGAGTLMTGFGGDAVYFQMASPDIVHDLVRRGGLPALWSDDFGQLARSLRQSAWALYGRAIRRRRSPRYPASDLGWLSPAAPVPAHPWMEGAEALSPSKRLHLLGLTHMLSGHGRSRRGEECDLIIPHLAQPVLELCLSVPADLLTRGGRDRALVREAFRGRLPDTVLDRRSKGDLGVLHARKFVADLPDLRDFLLGGELVKHDLVDRAGLEAALDETCLAIHGGHLPILQAAATEAWVQNWQGRISRLRAHEGAGGAALPAAGGA